MIDLGDLQALLAVARARSFRGAARSGEVSASALSDAVRRLESRLQVRLFHRTTRTVSPTEAGAQLIARLSPAVEQVEAALAVIEDFRGGVRGTLRLNVPVSAARLVLPAILPGFLAIYPDVRVEVVAEDSFVDVLAAGCDAGIRYDERLEQDMIAIPIGPRIQRTATAAAPSYLNRRGRPQHPRDLLAHDCIVGRFASGRTTTPWEFERGTEIVRIEPRGRLLTSVVGATDLAVDVAIAGEGVIHLFEDWLQPHLASGALEPLVQDWWQPYPGPFLYYSGRRLVPAALRAFIDYVVAQPWPPTRSARASPQQGGRP